MTLGSVGALLLGAYALTLAAALGAMAVRDRAYVGRHR